MIGVATTVWGSYGRYLPDWLASVAAQTRPPDQVVIVDLGAADNGWRDHVPDTLPVTVARAAYQGMGHARNTAIAHLATPWVMHLDADDLLLPHALADTEQLAPAADVVCLGAKIGNRTVLFPTVSAKRILRAALGSYSCSPYRRTLWQQRPYITTNDWVDSALWVGFAHLGARFAPTTRPGFVYRRHPDSHSRTLARVDKQAAVAQLTRLCRAWPT